MVRSNDVALLQGMAKLAADAAARGSRARALHWVRKFVRADAFVRAHAVRSPSRYYTQKSMSFFPTWNAIKEVKDDGAYMEFLGVPVFLFHDMLAEFKPHLPKGLCAEPDAKLAVPRAPGRPPSTFTAEDVLAICLRRCQMKRRAHKSLQTDFGRVDSTMGRYVRAGRKALRDMLRSWPPAAVCYPSEASADALMEAMLKNNGPPPAGFVPGRLLLGIDGTHTPVEKPSNDAWQRLWKGIKGHILNNIIAFCVDGTISDYVLAGFGCSHDTAVAKPLFDRLNSPTCNPAKVGAVLDNGYSSFVNAGTNGKPINVRPWKNGERVRADKFAFSKKVSAWVTRARQFNEHGNGSLKRSFPLFDSKAPVSNEAEFAAHVDDMECCIRLYNARTRIVGYAQIKSTYMPHISKNFQEQLTANTNIKEYMKKREEAWKLAVWKAAAAGKAAMDVDI